MGEFDLSDVSGNQGKKTIEVIRLPLKKITFEKKNTL